MSWHWQGEVRWPVMSSATSSTDNSTELCPVCFDKGIRSRYVPRHASPTGLSCASIRYAIRNSLVDSEVTKCKVVQVQKIGVRVRIAAIFSVRVGRGSGQGKFFQRVLTFLRSLPNIRFLGFAGTQTSDRIPPRPLSRFGLLRAFPTSYCW